MKEQINPEYTYEVRKVIGSWLKDMREEKKMTQDDLAQLMQLDRTTISKIEAGKWNFTINMLMLFAVHLDFFPFLYLKIGGQSL